MYGLRGRGFFFQAEDGIRDVAVTGVQTCALPIYDPSPEPGRQAGMDRPPRGRETPVRIVEEVQRTGLLRVAVVRRVQDRRASCRERVAFLVVEGALGGQY